MKILTPHLNLKKTAALTALALSVGLSSAHAYNVMASLNTLRKSRIPNAVDRLAANELNSDGVWFIDSMFSDFNDNEWRHIFITMGAPRISEDNPGSNASYQRYFRVLDPAKPNYCFVYNETGGAPGGTVLSNAQITDHHETHGGRPLLLLTRAYVPAVEPNEVGWKEAVDRVLPNPMVGGIVFEPVIEALLEAEGPGMHNGTPQLIDAVMNVGKRLYILLHGGGDEGWNDANINQAINKLIAWNPAAMASDRVTLVFQNYDNDPILSDDPLTDWFGRDNSVKSAIRIAKSKPQYTGNRKGFVRMHKRNAMDFVIDGNDRTGDDVNVHMFELNPTNDNQLWVEIPRGNGYFSYKKRGTGHVLDGGPGGENGQNVKLWREMTNNINQHWRKIPLGNNYYRLEKRLHPYSIDGSNGGRDFNNVKIWENISGNQNQEWRFY